MSDAAAYVSFEDRFRGSQEQILERLRQYGDLLDAFRPAAAGPEGVAIALDLGCGRGEWLELCRERRWRVEGVDGNPQMVERCRARGLPASCGDGLALLQAQASGSLGCLSAFHLIEHLGHGQLEALLQEAHRALRADGLLILETPNCDSWLVASQQFHLDPTHITRVHRDYLLHRLEAIGFEVSVAIGLNGHRRGHDWRNPSLRNVLESAAPDLALVASPRPGAPRRQALERWAEAHDCWSSAAIGDRFEERIQDLERRLDQQQQQLVALQRERSAEVPAGWRQRLRQWRQIWFRGG